MLKEMIEKDFGEDMDLNCAEKILYGANKAYDLNIDGDNLRLAAGFGGGMGIEGVCGALSGGVMALSKIYVKKVAHQSNIKEITTEFLGKYEKEMGSLNCAKLKEEYRTDELKCKLVILKAAEILDEIVLKYKS